MLNVTGALTGVNYRFAWTVRDPAGVSHNVNTQVNNAPSSFSTSINFPGSFSTSITLVGNYTGTVAQSSPCATSCPVGSEQFQVGLTNRTNYKRTDAVPIIAQGYGNQENVTLQVSESASPPILLIGTLADSTGFLSYSWIVPPSVPTGNYVVSLTGTTVKIILDSQTIRIDVTNTTISQLLITQSSLQRTQTETFRFLPSYPGGTPAKTGSAAIRITEADGTTTHNVTAVYKSSVNQFQATYKIPINSMVGAWVASIDIGGYDDGYGNMGPQTGVARGFAVSPAALALVVSSSSANYTSNQVVAVYASIVTPSYENFTSGTVILWTYYSTRQVKSPIQLLYDQSRGRWVGSFNVNLSDPTGVWVLQINATDGYGNSGYGSTSILVTLSPQSQPPPQQTLTTNFLLVVILGLAVALGVLGSWMLYRRGKVSRKVLRVDLEAVHAEAEKVENNEFFKRVKEQLKDQTRDSTGQKTG